MKNSKKPRYSAFYRVFSIVSALAVLASAGYLFYYGVILYGVIVLLFGGYIRYFVMFCARQDEDFERMQKEDFIKRDQFFY